jgi:putative transcriptional regulator
MSDIRELLPLYALGALDASEATQVERAVENDPSLAAELDGFLALVPAAVPGNDVKSRLMASIGAGRFERFSSRMASLFDVTIDRARELLGLVERGASWEAPMPGIGLVHFDGGPACATADCGFIRIAPGCTFPWHTHRGEEVSVILTGTLIDHEGRILRPGDELVQAQGSQHDISAQGDEEVIFVARAFNGIDVANKP